jgi:nucleoside-diphosphate-sugar epimerase
VHLLFLGYGYTARVLARNLQSNGWQLSASLRQLNNADSVVTAYAFPPVADDSVTHVLSSIPPDEAGDPILSLLPRYPKLQWAGYLSATSVYGDHKGAWVDEQSACQPTSARGNARLRAEQKWLSSGLPAHIFRLAGIYGPGRCVLDDLRAGTARRLDKPGQFFSRIHVDDVAKVLAASLAKPNAKSTYNVADDEPAPSADVMAYGATLLSLPVPALVPYDQATLSPMAASFYGDNKRVNNTRIKTELGVELKYPTYREGLKACL